jgi:hypothetical protein
MSYERVDRQIIVLSVPVCWRVLRSKTGNTRVDRQLVFSPVRTATQVSWTHWSLDGMIVVVLP